MSSKTERKIHSVSQLTYQIRRALDAQIRYVWVAGEVSNLVRAQSGHIYLTLKDERAQLKAVIWRSTAEQLKFDVEHGQKLICYGKLDVYSPRGEYQLVVERLEIEGEGALQAAFRQLYQRLANEGLFEPEYKKRLPSVPARIAIVTSPAGAAIMDFLKVLTRRWDTCDVLIVPTPVQGEGAAVQIARSILAVSRLRPRPDVLVVARGGGSLEDLWCFNEEAVVRAIFECEIPVITGIGHEVDVTLADLAADFRAATPSEAAERILPIRQELRASCDRLGKQLQASLLRRVDLYRQRLDALASSAALADPFQKLNEYALTLDDYALRLNRVVGSQLENVRERTRRLAAHLEGLSPLAVLTRGYGIVETTSGIPIDSIAGLAAGQTIGIRLRDGHATAEIQSAIADEAAEKT